MSQSVRRISAALEHDVLSFTRRHGVTLWLDRDAHYTAFVDGLAERYRAGEVAVPVVAFRGSFLDLIFAFERHVGGSANEALLVHLPGQTEETILDTPLLELWELGTRYRKALDTLVRDAAAGRVPPSDLEEFLAAPGLSLAGADAWLTARTTAAREGLAAFLDQISADVVAAELLVADTMLRAKVRSAEDVDDVAAFLERHTGMDAAWRSFIGGGTSGDGAPAPDRLDPLAEALAAWLLCVEYVHDLRRTPHLPQLQPLKALSKPLVERCCALVDRLRREQPERYAALADEVEPRLADEVTRIRAEDLGHIDTFRVEEMRVLEAAIADLIAGRWAEAAGKVAAREGANAFWLTRDQARRWAWQLVGQAASFGRRIADAPRPLAKVAGHEEALELYAEAAAPVDREHRRFEQARSLYLEPRLPHFAELKEVVEDLRRRYRRWADDIARDFSALCRAHGFLPPADLQQRTLYEQVVHPLTTIDGDRVAVIVVDALRYEMAADLAEELRGPGITVDLRARLAELPTLTAVGMNVLAPVAGGGRLTPVFAGGEVAGFRSGEYTVRGPADRARAMGERSVGRAALLLPLAEVWDAPPDRLKRQVANARLIVVASREIDDAGEANLGPASFETTLRQIRAACVHLQAAGVRSVVVTADHGFLLLDSTVETHPFGSRTEPNRRHVYAAEPRADGGLVPVALSSLGYEVADGYVLFREDTALFRTGATGVLFAHGGNSPQERIIPVLTLKRRREAAASRTAYEIEAVVLPAVLGHARVRLRLQPAVGQEQGLAFVSPSRIGLMLRAVGRDDVRVLVKEAQGAALDGGRVVLAPGTSAAEVFFALEGPRDERVQMEVFHPDGSQTVEVRILEGWFDVAGTGRPGLSEPPAAPTGDDWALAIADEGARQVFLHIARHGAITEEEAVRLLGSPRAARRFAAAFDDMKRQLPFLVRVETTERGKRYVKEREI
ncbi:alkaline phosphatase (plasmid) [Azospirillum sp. TSH58]|uniref:BREX-6 system phosphatase PglZ n=1 Tax=Azospirillum sp. TSH58 TaxID=664962 RepID=UPI000D602DBE|nr:BREX-6 system phosphatase PglZ [Azospirillum sp. TSH58]AWJ86774.1 alkaline phosphatase [Azospirillum sp. TSH58]PWC62887.1 hypothetical protein TSH58_24510 [Azospirillum sp. TSH58]